MLPKVRTPGDVEMTAKLLTQIELASGLEVGRIGIEAQIEDATGLIACEAIAAASPRMETLIFGPGDYSAAVGIPITTIGAAPDGYPGDHLNYVYTRLVVAARAAGIQAIDGPYGHIKDDDGPAGAVAAGARAGDRRQVDDPPGPDRGRQRGLQRPRREQWERAEAMLAAYERGARAGHGAAMFEGEMIDEANRKMAERIALAGRAAGYEHEPRRPPRAPGVAVVILVVAFIALRPSSDDPETTADAPTATPTATATETARPARRRPRRPTPTPTPKPDRRPRPGPDRQQGRQAPLRQGRHRALPGPLARGRRSPHPRLRHQEGRQGRPDRRTISFKATIDGIFEIEFEDSATADRGTARRPVEFRGVPCLAVLLAFISPRLAIIVVAIFSDILSRAYDSWFLPLIGFFLLPWTTLAYAIMWDVGTHDGDGLRMVRRRARVPRRPRLLRRRRARA